MAFVECPLLVDGSVWEVSARCTGRREVQEQGVRGRPAGARTVTESMRYAKALRLAYLRTTASSEFVTGRRKRRMSGVTAALEDDSGGAAAAGPETGATSVPPDT